MSQLERLLNQDEVAGAIVEFLRDDVHGLARLTGPSGAGKTYTAKLAAATWRDAGGRVAIIIGDPTKGTSMLFPFQSGMGTLPQHWRGLAAQGSRSALRVADVVVGTGGISSSIFDLLTSALRGKDEANLRHLSSDERGIVVDIQRIARSRRLLLIADRAHYWDADSLALLLEMLSPRLRSASSPLQSLAVLLVDTEQDQDMAAPMEFERLTNASRSATWSLELVDRERFGVVLELLGLEVELDDDTLDALHDITGGHLHLAEQLVADLNSGESPGLERMLRGGSGMTALLDRRLRSLDSSGVELAEMLTRAAVIGATFALAEIECLAADATVDIDRLLQRASRVNFVEVDSEALRFRHEVLRDHFLNTTEPHELRRLRSEYEQCLSLLRPGDYATRSALLRGAGDLPRARELFALAAIAELRKGTPRDRVLRDAVAGFPDDADLYLYLERMAMAYEAIATGAYDTPGATLQSPTAGESTEMAAERNYLRALCSMEAETAEGFVDALRILSQWRDEIRDEPELALRFLLLRQQAEVLNEDFHAARSTEATIEAQLVARRASDTSAERLMQVQNRRAAALNTPEIAEDRIARSVDFFRQTSTHDSGDALEYYRALTNHAAILIKLSRDADALVAAREAERLLLDRPTFFPRPDILAANLTLAARRAGAFSLDEAISHQREILLSPEGSSDGFIHQCNLVSYLLQAEEDEEAAELLDELASEIERSAIAESYLIYYWNVLSVSAALVEGRRDLARNMHDEMEDFVSNLRWPNARYAKRRHRLLGEFLHAIDPAEPRDQLDYVILNRHPEEIGPGWEYHARLFPCCELSFWSDS